MKNNIRRDFPLIETDDMEFAPRIITPDNISEDSDIEVTQIGRAHV